MLNKHLSIGGVDVWQGELNSDREQLDYFATLLDTAERVKAERFSTAILRDRYIETRGRTRCLLAEYCNYPPQALRFATEVHGKPYLPAFPDVAFNLSHSHHRLALAVAVGRGYHVGIDIEVWRERAALPALVRRCFAASEQAYWAALPKARQLEAFYVLWTQKEAFVKAVGRGLALGLEQCVVATEGNKRFIALPEEYANSADWQVVGLELGEAVSGALVIGW